MCCQNFVEGEKKKEKKEKNLMDMLFYLAQPSSLIVRSRFAAQAQDVWDFGPMSPVQ